MEINSFVRSGIAGAIWINDGWVADNAIGVVGLSIYAWSRSTDSSTLAFYFGSWDVVLSSASDVRYYGFPLRCLYAS